MKRKLNSDVDLERNSKKRLENANNVTFTDLGLDSRLLQAVLKKKYAKPTLVQAKGIPLALEGKDLLARAKTGSGKTATYLLPILHAILKRKAESPLTKSTSALILVPTRELAEQVTKAVASYTMFCAKDIRAVNLTPKVSEAVQRSLLADLPDIVISTPARASTNLTNRALSLEKLHHLVIDEADLVMSYGYDGDLRRVHESIPQGVQSFLISATLSDDVETLKGLFCRNPVTLRLEHDDEEGAGVTQYIVKCGEEEKFLLTYVMFKLKLVKGKAIIFVGDIDRSYRLKLFLEQFGIRSCVLNSELPVNSRLHIVSEFNKNVYDIIIASDESEVLNDDDGDDGQEQSAPATTSTTTTALNNDQLTTTTSTEPIATAELDHSSIPSVPAKKRRKHIKRDKDYSASRGLDIPSLSLVLNFDLPVSANSYTHRIGRTARASKPGTALSFVVPKSLYLSHPPTTFPSSQHDESILARIIRAQARLSRTVQDYAFDMKQVGAFRYRMEDALRAVTRTAVRDARLREVRAEIIRSERLERWFEENPQEAGWVRGEMGGVGANPIRNAQDLKSVPSYLLPQGEGIGGGGIAGEGGVLQARKAVDVGFVSLGKQNGEGGSRSRARWRKTHDNGKKKKVRAQAGRKVDVLKSFKRR